MTRTIAAFIVGCVVASSADAQQTRAPLARLPADQFDVVAPSARVSGRPGEMRVTDRSCSVHPDTELRRRIVDVAIQEWAFFGFGVVDQTNVPETETGPRARRRPWRPRAWLDAAESARVADTIAGYWSVTSDGSWILGRQNAVWKGAEGIGARWHDPWSAAFISWVMCEAGLSDKARFQRAIAHHTYIDQAIEARDDPSSAAAFVAYDVGEQAIEPGDLLCAARRPNYRTLAERRATLGTGIRSHCDIVVELDPDEGRILVIGGNVRGAVSLKIHAAVFTGESTVRSVGRGRRSVFAHLKLRADPIGEHALATSPTLRVLSEHDRESLRQRLVGESPAMETVRVSVPPDDSSVSGRGGAAAGDGAPAGGSVLVGGSASAGSSTAL